VLPSINRLVRNPEPGLRQHSATMLIGRTVGMPPFIIQDARILAAQMLSARICEICGCATELVAGAFQTHARCRDHIRDEEDGYVP